MQYIPLKEKYRNEIIPAMIKEFGYKNVFQVPRIEKIVINMGIGEGSRNKDVVDVHAKELALIAGQKPVITRAKKSISNFKIRKGMPIGLKVTLRGLNPNGFDGRGNYSFGLTEQLVFPEISPDQVKRVQGMDIVIVTTAKTDDEARKLLELFGFPFKR